MATVDAGDKELLEMKSCHKLKPHYWNREISDPKALVFISHGLNEHSLHYDKLAQVFVDSGCLVFAHDHLGHGESEGSRVLVHDFTEYTRDVMEHFERIAEKHPDKKRFIVGHSMGGTIATLTAIENPDYFAGVVLISPGFGLVNPPNDLAVGVVKMIGALLPAVPIAGIKPESISRNSEQVKRFNDDPLVWHGKAKAGWLRAYDRAFTNVKVATSRVEWPFLVMHGTADTITNSNDSVEFHQGAASRDKTIRIYDGFYHQLHNEPEPDGTAVRQEILDWILARV